MNRSYVATTAYALFLTALVLAFVSPASARQVSGRVASVDGLTVRVEIDPSAQVAVGDKLTISQEVPGVGRLAIDGQWRIRMVGQGFVIAEPIGDIGTTPHAGYEATIETSGVAKRPAKRRAPAAKPDPLVRDIQSGLRDLGYDPGPADGLMGSRTRDAIRSYQLREGLTVDGRPSAQLLSSVREQLDARQAPPAPAVEEPLPWQRSAPEAPPAPPRVQRYPREIPPGELPWLHPSPEPRSTGTQDVVREAPAGPLPWQQPAPREAGPDSAAAPALRSRTTTRYALVWKDTGSGADDDFATYRGQAEGAFHPLGDVAVSGHWESGNRRPDLPTVSTMLVASGRLSLAKPLRYEKVWTDSGSGADWDYALWQPVAPQGYTCIGQVGGRAHNQPPPIEALRCVPSECAERLRVGAKIWDSRGSYSDRDFSAWKHPFAGLYIGNGNDWDRAPTQPVFGIKRACLE